MSTAARILVLWAGVSVALLIAWVIACSTGRYLTRLRANAAEADDFRNWENEYAEWRRQASQAQHPSVVVWDQEQGGY